MNSVNQLIIPAIIMLLLDSIYLNLISGFFNQVVLRVQGSKIKLNILGAVLCYMFLIYGLNYFIISERKSIYDAFVLGIIIYGVYETTNYAILKDWSFFCSNY